MMSAFRFNFQNNESLDSESKPPTDKISWIASEEVNPSYQIHNLDEIVKHAKIYTNGDLEIGHVAASEVTNNAQMKCLNNGLNLAEQKHSDLIAGTYEGGLKIWECTSDLVKYLMNNIDTNAWNNAKVLDLGCGAGILGILAFLNGSEVFFQDYNKEVIEHVTIPNVLLNIEDEEKRELEINKCKFYSGDWESFNKLLDNNQFHYILTSETIYNSENYNKIIDIINTRLTDKGTAFIAAKTVYFGVGGGVRDFETYLQKHKHLNVDICWKSSGGIQREILKVTKK